MEGNEITGSLSRASRQRTGTFDDARSHRSGPITDLFAGPWLLHAYWALSH